MGWRSHNEKQGSVAKSRSRGFPSLAPDMPLREAAQRMSALGVRMLPVCDGGRVVGVLTLRDITVRATAEGRDPFASKVREVMTRPVNGSGVAAAKRRPRKRWPRAFTECETRP